MELSELHSIWKEYDKKISENTRINKEILRLILLEKPRKRFNWIKIKAASWLFSPLLFVFLILILDVQFKISTRFFIGLGLFLPVIAITYFWDIKYFKLIHGIDFSKPILSIKRNIAELEKYKIKTTKIRYLLGPIAMVGYMLMIIQKITISLDFFSILPLFLIVLVFFSSFYFTLNYSVIDRFRKLNKDIDEIVQLEKE